MQLARLAGNRSPLRLALLAALALVPSVLVAQDAPGGGGSGTIERIRAAGKVTFGYYAEARPLSFRYNTGDADGYAVALCRLVAADLSKSLNVPGLATQFVAVEGNERIVGV